jgi:uncharacterized membrane protein YebE (DUF533 family)
MNAFLRQSIKEHKRKTEMKQMFIEHNKKASEIVRAVKINAPNAPDYIQNFERRCLILLAPLVETAWADGSVKAREMDVIFQVAEGYGLDQDDEIYAELIDSMLSRATPAQVAEKWREFHELWQFLPAEGSETLGFCLMMQARFVAEQCSNNAVSYLRGDRVSTNENEILQKILGELETARANKAEFERQKSTFADEFCAGKTTAEEIAELLPLVPLVKVAWAEGRITKREREIILRKAEMMGIVPETSAFQRLSDWLELHPTDDFYLESLERLRESLLSMPDDERDLLHLDLISDCVNIAEASGGTRRYPAGGPRVCDEEFAAVERIAERINIRAISAAC